MVSIFASETSCPWFDSRHYKKISEAKIVDAAEANQKRSLEESRQWLQTVDQTHLVLASGKQILQKDITKLK